MISIDKTQKRAVLTEYKMRRNKVREVQEYLHKEGIEASETAIIKAAIDIARRLSGMGDWVFVREFRKGRR